MSNKTPCSVSLSWLVLMAVNSREGARAPEQTLVRRRSPVELLSDCRGQGWHQPGHGCGCQEPPLSLLPFPSVGRGRTCRCLLLHILYPLLPIAASKLPAHSHPCPSEPEQKGGKQPPLLPQTPSVYTFRAWRCHLKTCSSLCCSTAGSGLWPATTHFSTAARVLQSEAVSEVLVVSSRIYCY